MYFFRIRSARFKETKKDIQACFPTYNADNLYLGRHYNVSKECVDALGSAYYFYKSYRRDLISAEELTIKQRSPPTNTNSNNVEGKLQHRKFFILFNYFLYNLHFNF